MKDTIVGAVMGGENLRHSIEGMIYKNLLSANRSWARPARIAGHAEQIGVAPQKL